jgi:glycosyltransferase involved in cell wall biosynthesis
VRVLVFPSWYPPDGGSFFVEQIQALQKIGIKDISVLYAEPVGLRKIFSNGFKSTIRKFRIERNEEFGIITIRKKYYQLPKFQLVNLYLQTKAFLCLFDQFQKDNRMPDVIHVHSAVWAGWAAYKIKQRYEIPYVITEHRGRFTLNHPSCRKKVKGWFSFFLTRIYGNANRVILVARHLINGLQKYIAPDDGRIAIIPNGVFTDRFSMKEEKKKEAFTFVSVGGLNFLKGYDVLLKAFEILLNKSTADIRLEIVGGGSEERTLKELSLSLGLQDHVFFWGSQSREEVASILRNSDAFVLATRLEAQPVCFIEAMSCGLPIVATEAVPEEICPEFVGFRVPVDSVNSIASAMEDVLLNYRTFDNYKIREFAISSFDFLKVAGKIMQVYEQTFENPLCGT